MPAMTEVDAETLVAAHYRRGRRARQVIAGLAAALLVASLLSLAIGAVRLPFGRLLSLLFAGLSSADVSGAGLSAADARMASVLLSIRLPRLVASLVVGAALSICGAALQGLFRNPLASPALLGTATGAGLAVALVIVLTPAAAPLWIRPAAAFGGSLAAVVLVYLLATRAGVTELATLVLAGIAINAVAGAANGALVFVADDNQLRDISFWTLGSLGGITWQALASSAAFLMAPLVLLPRLASGFDALALGEREASLLGTGVQRVKLVAVLVCAAGVGAAVSISGVIGFIGLVGPHLARLVVGDSHGRLFPASALTGALLLVTADLVARTVVAPAELPVGVVTALLGGPFFLRLLIRNRSLRHA